MKKKFILIGIFILFLFAIIISNKKEDKTNNGKPTIKIGASLPLTGDLSLSGQDYQKSIMMRVDELNNSNSKYEYKVFFEDDQFQAKKEILNAQKLISVDKVDVLITFAAGGCYTISELAEKNKVIYFDFTWGDDVVKINQYSFHNFTDPCDMGAKLLKKSRELGYRRFSIIGLNHSGAQYSTNCFKNEVSKYDDMAILDEQTINGNEKDFELLIEKMETKHPDAYFIELYTPALEIFGRNLKKQNIKTPLIANTTFYFSNDLRLFEGTLMSGNASPSDEYMEKFKNKYGSYPANPASVFCYDVVDFISSIYEKYDSKPTTTQVKDDLLLIKDYNSSIGKISSNKYGIFRSEPVLAIVKDSKIVNIEE